MSQEEIEQIMELVRETARTRHSWINDLRYASDDEFEAARRVCEMYPTKEQEIDNTKTVVIHG